MISMVSFWSAFGNYPSGGVASSGVGSSREVLTTTLDDSAKRQGHDAMA